MTNDQNLIELLGRQTVRRPRNGPAGLSQGLSTESVDGVELYHRSVPARMRGNMRNICVSSHSLEPSRQS